MCLRVQQVTVFLTREETLELQSLLHKFLVILMPLLPPVMGPTTLLVAQTKAVPPWEGDSTWGWGGETLPEGTGGELHLGLGKAWRAVEGGSLKVLLLAKGIL